ncbi:MAG: TonB-dependent receptor [Acidobacteria bacterium]|nr:TonB-dependent receptor [Acidobacteriota bacterium]MBI3424517.1 TonB-dependent receptor [Acidobacteriota bacterium]
MTSLGKNPFGAAAGSLAVLCAMLLCAGSAFAQIKSGAITGTVTDPTGAVIPGATVTVINAETNVSTTAVTDATGNFNVPYLAPGTYTVNVEKAASGFSRASRTGVNVLTAQTLQLEIRLQAGATNDTVTITADAATLQTTSATVGGSVNERVVQTLPNITHNPFSYVALQAGITPRGAFNNTQSTTSFGIGIDGRRQASAIGINGGSAFSNDIVLDGVSVQGSAWNEVAVLPNQDALQEVKTITNNYSAEYGRAQGVVIFTTKGGSNDFHGTGFYRIRNEALNANSFSNNAQNIGRGPFKSHTYGGTYGGRILRDRAFFFASYEGLYFNRNYDYLKTVPTAKERAGDFSETYINVGGKPVPIKIFDPFNVTRVGTTSQYTRAQFPTFTDAAGLVHTTALPTTRLNAQGLALLKAYPLPNRTPDDVFNNNNFFNRGLQTFRKNNVNSRVDWNWRNHNFYSTGGLQMGNIQTPRSWGGDNPYYSRNEFVGNKQPDKNPYISIGDTWSIKPSLVLDVRFGVNRIHSDNEADAFKDFDFNQFGIPKEIQALDLTGGSPPTFQPGRVSDLSFNMFLHKRERQTNSDFNASMTWTHGRWTHKFGGTYRVLLSNYNDLFDSVNIVTGDQYTRANINADGSTTGLPATPDATYNGLALASVALGAGFLEVRSGFTVRLALAQKYQALYTQNDWRVNDRLTLNLGLRYDIQPGPTERFNHISSIDLNQKNPFGTAGKVIFPGANVDRRNMWPTEYTDFGPRFGVAYQLRRSLVLRGGYGLTFVPSNTGYNDGPGFYGAGPFAPATITSNLNAGNNSSPYGTSPAGVLVAPFNSLSINTIVQPTGTNESDPGIYGGLVRRFPQDYKNGYVQQWNAIFEQKIGNNWIVSAGYVGSHGSRLQVTFIPINSAQLVDQALLSDWRNTYIQSNGATNPSTQQVQNPWQPATGALIPFGAGNIRNRTIQRIETAFPYPHHGNNIHLTVGQSDYHAMQLQVTRQFSSGLQFNAHYTWSKLLEMSNYNAQSNNGYADSNANYFANIRPDLYRTNRKPSTNDLPHRIVASWVYDMPIGGGKLLDLKNKVANGVLGGWRLGGSASIQSGLVSQISGGATNAINGLPDLVPGVDFEVPKALQKWYDGKTSVTLPSGRVITPCNRCFLKYNIDAFAGRVATTPNGAQVADLFWYGTSAAGFSAIRSPLTWNSNLALERNIKFGERYALNLSAQATNVFNHTQFRSSINTSTGGTVLPATITANPTQNLKVGQLQSSGTFGTYGLTTNDPRQIEMVLKFRF